MLLILIDLTKFCLVLCDWSFQVLGEITMDEGIRSGKSLSLGFPEAPQGNIQERLKRLSLGTPRKESPLSSLSIGLSLEAIFLFITWYEFCLECHLFSFAFTFSLPQSLFYGQTYLRETHFHHNLLVYSMCFTYIFWARQLLDFYYTTYSCRLVLGLQAQSFVGQ